VYSFFVTYANLITRNSVRVLAAVKYSRQVDSGAFAVADWRCDERHRQRAAGEITRSIEQFVDELSNWYVRRGAVVSGNAKAMKTSKAAYQTLHEYS
jgi:isoleucyl-tRNA synthetase